MVSQHPETCVPMPFGSFFGTTDEVSFLYVHRKKKRQEERGWQFRGAAQLHACETS